MLNKKPGLATMLLVAALSATTLAACGATKTRESTGEYIDDSTITAKVKTAFVQSKEVSAANIQVETFKGKVQLSGFADSNREIERATEIAREVAGVRSVRNDIRLKSTR